MVVQRLVSEVMTQPVISVTPQTLLQEAVKLLSDHHISGLPVVDGGKLVGELMVGHPHTCKPDLALPAAAKLLQDRRTQRLFVVDGQQALVGVLTRGDVVRALAEAGA